MAIDRSSMDNDLRNRDTARDFASDRSPQVRARQMLNAGIVDLSEIAFQTGLSVEDVMGLDNGGIGSIDPGLYASDSRGDRDSGSDLGSEDLYEDNERLRRMGASPGRRWDQPETRTTGQNLGRRHMRGKNYA